MKMLTVSLLVCAMMALAAAHKIINIQMLVEQGPCPDDFEHHNGRCYRFVPDLLPWAEAEINCQSMEANLASVHTLEQDQFLQRMIRTNAPDNPPAWIGGSDCQKKDLWLWSNGKSSPFRNWCDDPMDRPHDDKRCLQTNHRDTTCWDDRECSLYRSSVCALDMPASLTCPKDFSPYNGRCFRFVPDQLPWAEAEINCQSMEANLASVHSLEEDRFLQQMIYSNTLQYTPAWIGASDCQKDNLWLWSNGKKSPFKNWCHGPMERTHNNTHCTLMNNKARTCWDNQECSLDRPSVCVLNNLTTLPCDKDWNHHNGRCYRFVSNQLPWAEAEMNCQSMEAHLASVSSLEEDRFLQQIIYSNTHEYTPTWIGGSNCQKVEDWFWTNGNISPFRNWCDDPKTQAKHGCIVVNYRARTCWDDQKCSVYGPSVCAMDVRDVLHQPTSQTPAGV